ncbi:hypothetical protein AMAG_10976 [Allomyces macrogynus ATCC 38327]|uniref:Uncharacterized protein n=1 Tax=Allomyces macrogynus (strain ATCC 38327) TaxID=578462 RepID=A0A0L0SSI6_ALLM3|nr:hypothetical protein AMAG_10976 [Allomyces macrogynus ATCC 38327]|eukprot:KNE65334.1 hypothetical protein AMAG_10976 [Allomyces macrogynus ATCC 38327]
MPMPALSNQYPRRPSVPPRPQSSLADAIVMARARHRAHSILLPSAAGIPSSTESLRWQRRQSLVSSGFDSDSDDEQSDLSTSTESTSTSTHGFRETCDGDRAVKEASWEPVLTERRLDRFMKALDELLVMSSADVHAILPRLPGYEEASLDHETPAYGPANPVVEERVHEALFPSSTIDPWVDDDFEDEGLTMLPPESAGKRTSRRLRSRTSRSFTPTRRPSDSGVSMTSSADNDHGFPLYPANDDLTDDDDDEDIPLADLRRRTSAPHVSTAHLVARSLLSRTTRSHSLPHLLHRAPTTSTAPLAIPRVATPVTGPVAFASPDVKRTPTLRRRVSVRGRRTAKRRASYALYGKAEVVYQRRTYQWVVEPVVGGEVEVRSVAAQVTGLDAPPRPWDVDLGGGKMREGLEEGRECAVSVEVPRTAVVMPCHVCAQQGYVACPTCSSPSLTHPPPISHSPCTTCRGTHHVPCAVCQSHCVLRLFLVVTATWTRQTATLANTGGARGVPVTSLATASALIDVDRLADLPAGTLGPDVARVRADVEALLDALMAEVRPEFGEGVVVEKIGYRLRAMPVDQVQVTRRRWFHADTVESYVQVGEHQVVM